MKNDQIFGFIMLLLSLAGIVAETWFLILEIIINPSKYNSVPFINTPVYWALSLPIWAAATGLLAILGWIGYTLLITPPPESWTFEEEEGTSEDIAS